MEKKKAIPSSPRSMKTNCISQRYLRFPTQMRCLTKYHKCYYIHTRSLVVVCCSVQEYALPYQVENCLSSQRKLNRFSAICQICDFSVIIVRLAMADGVFDVHFSCVVVHICKFCYIIEHRLQLFWQ